MLCCLNFIREWQDLQFNVDSERHIFEKGFHGRFIYSQNFCQKSAKRTLPKKYFSYFIFDDWPGIRTQAYVTNKPTHYILDHGDSYPIIPANIARKTVFTTFCLDIYLTTVLHKSIHSAVNLMIKPLPYNFICFICL